MSDDKAMLEEQVSVASPPELAERERTYAHIAQSLARRYATIYYVDAQTKAYTEFTSTDTYKELGAPSSGQDFFADSRKNSLRVIHPDDVSDVLAIMDRDRLTEAIDREGELSLTYRLIMGGKPLYANLRARWADDHRHLIVAVADVDRETRIEMARQKEREEGLVYSQIARNLANRYAAIYYIDVQTNSYVDFTSTSVRSNLELATHGDDFFAETLEELLRVVHPEDKDLVRDALTKEALLKGIAPKGSFTRTYRVVIDGEVSFARLTATLTDDRKHLIVGMSDVSAEVQGQLDARKADERSKVFGHIAKSLARRYATIYFVDVYTKNYTEFTATDIYKELEAPSTGEDFFADSRANVLRVIHPDDVDAVLAIMDRDRMTQLINENGVCEVTYRLNMGGREMYAQLQAMWADDRRHLIVGVADVDRQMRREMASREREEQGRVYSYIAQSLANQYATIYYVDVYTKNFRVFTSSDLYKDLDVAIAGEDFFAESVANAQAVIHPEDVDAMLDVMDRDRMTNLVNENGLLTVTYRLLVDGEWRYTNMRAMWAEDMRHMIVAVSDVDRQTRREMAQLEAAERGITYSHIAQSLANNYDSIYYVDTADNSYTEYSSTNEYKSLNVQVEGDDFFADSHENIKKLVYSDDRDLVLSAISRENLLAELRSRDRYSINYRLLMGGTSGICEPAGGMGR